MIDHVLGRPSNKSRRLQVLAVLAFWSAYLYRQVLGDRHGPPLIRRLSRLSSKVTTWQTVVITMMYLYAARNFSTLVGLASPEPMANMYDAAYFRATWVLTALDAGFWTAMKIKRKWLRDIASTVFSIFYMVAAEQADEKVRRVRGMLTVEHLRVSWNKGTTPYLQFFQNLIRPRFTRWPPRAIRIPRPSMSDYKEPVSGWLYYDGPISDLEHINKMILDIPGGGFVAMDPRCNDDKLFAWAGKTGLPVLSLDYKKAPEFPYPYALNECFDVYTTIVKSKGRCVGMSGREMPKVVVTGDSAGGNLATAMTLMIIETRTTKKRPGLTQTELPVPDGLILLYPGLDMNIGNWMSDEQMSLVQDRRLRGTNKDYLRRKSHQFNDLVGTPHPSDDEDDSPPQNGTPKSSSDVAAKQSPEIAVVDENGVRSPHPEYSHANRQSWANAQVTPPPSTNQNGKSILHKPGPMRTRLAMASMISYFNDRVLTPEMMRAMIILYVGPHNRPDFSQDYLLSPILAPDILLQQFPKTHFLTGERDPLVDDTVIFAGRLRKVKQAYYSQRKSQGIEGLDDISDFDEKDVVEVVLIPGISHGFTQFPTVYPPAWKLINRCALWATDLLNAAENREKYEQQMRRPRHHFRVESSDAEDRPLEMSMTRSRVRTVNDESKAKEVVAGQSGNSHNPEAAENGTHRKKRSDRARLGAKSKSIIRLKSSDDLLGRRMQGLAGALTGTGDED
ncbi:Alpha/Beta hydrolase protein [Pseudomassariella vexata]|uniref:Alpha/Beta hydrolase protein n=1 Tax=Pseudomassariella vexata TaxID=1141098 RepID=A0A1Y2DA72_9PEZI|nr:Alpha/Beta hydrolase protein [Pseudomassariella vexata]ORY56163.1 Alpha/Beta hydrolase protein [Pseudomassariella vexata]